MLLSCFLLAISVSIDSLGIGITYGIKNTKISNIGKIILFFVSFLASIVSIWFGENIKIIFSENVSQLIGFFILIFMGFFILYQSFHEKTKPIESVSWQKEKVYKIFIKCLGITIQIIKDPKLSDFDNSNKIDGKEALFLGFALSLDAFCVGIGSSIIGMPPTLFPLFASVFQLIFLSFGNLLGRKLRKCTNLPDNIWSIISGLLLIFIAIIKII